MACQPMEVPKHFLIDLTNYDDKLRVKWDFKDEYWRIERKGRWGAYDMTNPQDREAKREGYVVALRVPPDCLQWRQVREALYLGDIRRRGGWRAVAKEIEEREQYNREKSQRDFSEDNEYRAKERWTSWNTNYPKGKYGRRDYLAGF